MTIVTTIAIAVPIVWLVIVLFHAFTFDRDRHDEWMGDYTADGNWREKEWDVAGKLKEKVKRL